MTSKTLTAPTGALGTWAWGDSGEVGDGWFGSRMTETGLREVVEKAQTNGFTLPAPVDGVYYIVSRAVALACPDRIDLVVPGTVRVRPPHGVLGCADLVRYHRRQRQN